MKLHHRIAPGWAALLLAGAAHAHEGHDEAPQAGPAPAATPGIEAHSDLFELVGNVEHGALVIYLDRYADNAPVKDARIEVESGDQKAWASPNPDGSYTVRSALFAKPASVPLTFTITAGKDTDLLAADLILPAAPPDAGARPAPPITAGAGAALTLALLAAFVARLALRLRRKRTQGAAA